MCTASRRETNRCKQLTESQLSSAALMHIKQQMMGERTSVSLIIRRLYLVDFPTRYQSCCVCLVKASGIHWRKHQFSVLQRCYWCFNTLLWVVHAHACIAWLFILLQTVTSLRKKQKTSLCTLRACTFETPHSMKVKFIIYNKAIITKTSADSEGIILKALIYY